MVKKRFVSQHHVNTCENVQNSKYIHSMGCTKLVPAQCNGSLFHKLALTVTLYHQI